MRTGGAAGGGGKRAPGAQAEVGERDDGGRRGSLKVVGIGPGSLDDISPRARAAIEGSDTVVGYKTYIGLIRPLLGGRRVISTGMKAEAERCMEAVGLAEGGAAVALISSGDPGVYGMAGLALEIISGKYPHAVPFGFEVIPGIPAVCSAAAALGAPLMHDFAAVSLSDLLTPWELIEKRLDAAASADFVIALYNPRSKGRPGYLDRAREIVKRHRPGTTPVGIVKDSAREGERVIISTLDAMPVSEVDMTTMVIVGNSASFSSLGRIVTPRGYKGRRF